MRSILYFTLLFVVFGSSSLFAVEQVERKKTDAGESVSSVHENVDVRKNLKQDAPESTAQGTKPESSKSDPTDVDKLNVGKAQDTEAKGAINKKEPQHDESKAPAVEKTIGGGEQSDKDFGNNLLEKTKDEVTPNLPSVTDKEVNKNLVLPPSAGLNEDVADLQKSLQVDKEVDIEENKPSKNNTDKLLEEKKEKEEDQAEKEGVKKLAEDHSRKNRIKPITRRDEENKQEEEKNLQRWTKLDREPIKEWYQKSAQSKSLYKRQYNKLNEHIPTTVFIDDYSMQLFYCIKKNNLVCLRGIISKLEKLGLATQEVLKLRNKLGDTPLIYAVKQGEVDIVRFLLLQGADPKAVNNSLQSPIDIAIERGRVDMINAITEMIPHLLEHKRIDNKESLEMYNWAVKTKEDNELRCNEDQER
ncbi:MAG: ankyrin repeat domain-containing protein [Wolbachia sp.]